MFIVSMKTHEAWVYWLVLISISQPSPKTNNNEKSRNIAEKSKTESLELWSTWAPSFFYPDMVEPPTPIHWVDPGDDDKAKRDATGRESGQLCEHTMMHNRKR